jgi:2-keto-4-pentenoate hydratase/2-oxohepta-3-ene-1,7-dioic acid hydratase in catechol pathway
MRIVSYGSLRGIRAGVLRNGRVLDAWDALGDKYPSPSAGVRELLPFVHTALADAHARVPVDDELSPDRIILEAPVPDPEKIICIGLNYRSHAEEAGLEPPAAPTFFAKFRNALVPSGARVTLPHTSEKVDYEAEVAFVVAGYCRNVAEDEALGYVAGYMLFNDLSARDLQFATPQWMPGKVFDGSAPCGPALVTPDEAGPHDAIEIALTLNGEIMQSASTADLIFSVPALLAHLSTLMTLKPGDIVSTGTPAGVGSVRQPRVWLKAGDEIVVSSPTLGRLETTIAG